MEGIEKFITVGDVRDAVVVGFDARGDGGDEQLDEATNAIVVVVVVVVVVVLVMVIVIVMVVDGLGAQNTNRC